MKYLFVIAFLIVYFSCGIELGYSLFSPIYTHITYMFQHSGITHLVLNSVAFIGMFHSVQKFLSKWVILPAIIVSGFAASFLSMYETPTVGASSMIYALIGLYIGLTLFCRKIKIADTKKYLLFLSCVLAGLLVSFLKHNSNLLVHIYSLMAGILASTIISIKRNYQKP